MKRLAVSRSDVGELRMYAVADGYLSSEEYVRIS
jgi:hypothetical protein